MTAEREIDYEALAQSAMRGIVRTVLARVAKSGLPGEHHFYIAFKTGAPGVVLSKRLKERYPEEMTVVLQHRFWDLLVNDSGALFKRDGAGSFIDPVGGTYYVEFVTAGTVRATFE